MFAIANATSFWVICLATIAEAIPNSNLRIVDGAAHLLNVEQPVAVTAAISEHLAPILAGRPA